MKRLILWGLCCCLGIVPMALAQTNQEESLPVDAADLRETATGLVLSIYGVLSDACQVPLGVVQTRQYNTIFIEVTRSIPSDLVCPMTETLYELHVALEGEFVAHDPITLMVNEWTSQFQLGTLTLNDGREVLDLEGTVSLLPMLRQEVRADSVAFIEQDGRVALEVSGTHPDGCQTPVIARQSVDERGQTVVMLYRVLPLDVMCTMVISPFTQSIPTQLPIDQETTFIVNGQSYTYTPKISDTSEGDSTMTRVYHGINNVQVMILESLPPQVQVRVTGHQSDGCMLPVQVVQSRQGNTFKIEIFREMPPDTMCPMVMVEYNEVIRLEHRFESGNYTVDVNGTTASVRIE